MQAFATDFNSLSPEYGYSITIPEGLFAVDSGNTEEKTASPGMMDYMAASLTTPQSRAGC